MSGTQRWIACADRLPPEGVVVLTVIDDKFGRRNEQPLKRVGRLWYLSYICMFVGYTPTHWLEVT